MWVFRNGFLSAQLHVTMQIMQTAKVGWKFKKRLLNSLHVFDSQWSDMAGPGRNQSRCCENTMEPGQLSVFWNTHSFSYQPELYCKSFYSQCLRRAPCLLPSPWFARPNPNPSYEKWPPVHPGINGSKRSSFRGMRSHVEAWGFFDNGLWKQTMEVWAVADPGLFPLLFESSSDLINSLVFAASSIWICFCSLWV